MSSESSPEPEWIAPDWASLSKQEASDLAHDRLVVVNAEHKAASKVLRRDWPNLSPGERSAGSRHVKQLEAEQQALRDVLEINRPEMP